jgi:hypothetical protein
MHRQVLGQVRTHSVAAARLRRDLLRDRMSQATRFADPQSSAYDLAGNRTGHSRAGTTSTPTHSGSSNRLVGIAGGMSRSLAYDGAGNLASDGVMSFGYDEVGRLASAHASGTLVGDYRSNPLNQRVNKSSPGAVRRFAYGPSGELLYAGGRRSLPTVLGRPSSAPRMQASIAPLQWTRLGASIWDSRGSSHAS